LILGIGIGYRMHAVPAANPEMSELRSELSQTKQMVALSLMQQQSATDRLRGVNWSYRLQQPSAEVLHALLDTLMHDSNVNVRLATVDALRQFGNQPDVRRGLVNAISQQESPMVQIALIDAAVDLRDKESVGTLRKLTQDQSADSAVRDRAQKALEQLE
jgi:HEAT repeat protein